jgi:thiamine transport system substrate-binding protein
MNIYRISCVVGLLACITFEALADKPVLTVYTYESFTSDWGPGPAVESNFEEICDCDLQFVGLDSSIGILGRIQLEGDATKADIVLGLDTNLVHLAKKTGYFAPLSSEIRQINNATNSLPISYDDDVFMPFDWGWFGFVYKKDVLITPPTSFDELLNMSNDIKIVIQDPRTSTPGLGLLLWIKSVYGDDAAEYWEALQPKILTVTKGWSEAYSLFLDGEADMVLSYTTSPAYHLIAEEDNSFDAANFSGGHYMQIEVAGMLKSTSQRELATQFLKFVSSPAFQNIIPTTNWMYPAFDAEIPERFKSLAQPTKSYLFNSEIVASNQKNWIDEWLSSSIK